MTNSTNISTSSDNTAMRRLAEFLMPSSTERLLIEKIPHPAGPTALCFCDSLFSTLRICLKGWLLDLLLRLPFDGPKIWFLRRLGARIGNPVHLSPMIWIDPLYPQLLTIEDNVFIGMHTRITLHEFRRDEFRAGRVIIRSGAFIGGGAMIGCGVEIGADATVAAGCVLGRDVPPGTTAIGNPARIVQRGDNHG